MKDSTILNRKRSVARTCPDTDWQKKKKKEGVEKDNKEKKEKKQMCVLLFT